MKGATSDFRPAHSGMGGGGGGQLPPPGKLIFSSNIVFDFVGLFLVDILVRNLKTTD